MNLNFLTPEKYHALRGDHRTLDELRALAANNARCENCGAHVWRLADTGLCFTCTTGEADRSDDYEIGAPYA